MITKAMFQSNGKFELLKPEDPIELDDAKIDWMNKEP